MAHAAASSRVLVGEGYAPVLIGFTAARCDETTVSI
jgi:hypothetical protein